MERAKNQGTYDAQTPLDTALRGAIRARNMDMMDYLESLCEAPVAFPCHSSRSDRNWGCGDRAVVFTTEGLLRARFGFIQRAAMGRAT